MGMKILVEAADNLIPDGYKKTETGVIPLDWETVELGEVSEIRMCKRIFSYQTSEAGEVPFFKIGTFGRQPDAYISKSTFTEYKSKYSYPKKGDVLLSAAGTLGRTVVFDGVDAYFQDSNIVWLDVDKTRIKNEYLYHYYQVIQWASPEGSTIARLYNGVIRATKIALPPLAEQTAIANALSDVDALIEGLGKLIAKKQSIKTATMQQLLTGKTRLPEFAHHPDGSAKGYKTTELGEVPEDWEIMAFSSVALPSTKRINPKITGGGELCIELEHISQGGGRLLAFTETKIESSLKNEFEAGDVLFGKLRPYLRKYWEADRAGVCSTEFWVFKPKTDSVVSKFLLYLVQADSFIEAASEAYGTHMPRADWKVVREHLVVLPESKEQLAIATVLSDMDAEIEQLQNRLNKTRAIKQGMMQELLTGKTRLPLAQ